ncbi:mechanosensitive ion channel family protein [Armatimonas rosea]|uniref:Small conductance mechanosensitive channel n=1 Tax=Armatimonas rosea TaxID=685828 RepID=A0A7W9W7F5_ARMRO|nr:mechanosensitive ion channel domain-containing protein [Armatimonas rosea]MBB6051603.1 small conductance mechanosensitive channel [Armatimonas rosea]
MQPTPAPSPTPKPPVSTRGVVEELSELTGLERLAYRQIVLFLLEFVLLIGLYIGLRWLLKRGVRRVGEQLANKAATEHQAARVRSLATILQHTLHFVLAFVFIVSALSLLGINVAPIIGTASVAGLAFGFGAQKLVKDVITGYFLLLEDQYVAGDYVTIGAVTGVVEELGMRITRIRDDDGKLYILSNGDIASVCNHSRGLVGASFELSVAAAEDIAAVTKLIEETLAQQNLPEPPRVEGVTLADAAKTTLKITFKAPKGQRPAQLLPHLRATLRDALLAAKITLA